MKGGQALSRKGQPAQVRSVLLISIRDISNRGSRIVPGRERPAPHEALDEEQRLEEKIDTVSSHNVDSRHFKSRVSNPRTVAYAHFKVPFESSNLLGAGPTFFPD